MLVLQRVGHDVRSDTFPYRDVQHLRVDEALLRGNLHLAVAGRPYDLPYNTVGQDLMSRIVDLVRQRYGAQRSADPAGDATGGPRRRTQLPVRATARTGRAALDRHAPPGRPGQRSGRVSRVECSPPPPLPDRRQAASGVDAPDRWPRAQDRRQGPGLRLPLAGHLRDRYHLHPDRQPQWRSLGSTMPRTPPSTSSSVPAEAAASTSSPATTPRSGPTRRTSSALPQVARQTPRARGRTSPA